MNNIKIGHKTVYYNEIIHPTKFTELYKKEKNIQKFSSIVSTSTIRPFFTFHSDKRKK